MDHPTAYREETLRHLLPFLIPHRRNRKDRGNMLVSEPFNPEAPSSLSHFPFFFLASILREFARFRVLLRIGMREREKVVGDGGRVWRNDSIVNESCSAPPPNGRQSAISTLTPPLPPSAPPHRQSYQELSLLHESEIYHSFVPHLWLHFG